MPYDITLAPEAVEDLQRLSANIRATVRAALTSYLRYQPMQVGQSRIKHLRGLARPQYRLRVNEIRIFYDVQGTDVEVLAIIDKGETTAWLAQYGEIDEADTALGSEE